MAQRVIGIYQAITYNEYVPALLGEVLPAYGGYRAEVNPGTDAFFAMAAYRYGHSGINSVYLRMDRNGRSLQQGHLLLRDSFFSPDYLQYGGIESILRGLVMQLEQVCHHRVVLRSRCAN
jgi:peroxidase